MATTGAGSSSSAPSNNSIQHTLNHPSSNPYMKPPLPSPQFRQQGTLQRSHPPHPHLLTTFSPSQIASSQRIQQHTASQFAPSRTPHPSPHQLPPGRSHIPSVHRSSSLPITPPLCKSDSMDADESAHRILSKRSIHELVFQIDPSERLESGVEDILEDIANDFVESITTFGCTLAKHRKSTTLEAKDILLHLERNWNMVIPGFSGDEIKTFRKPVVVDVHRERLAAIKKSATAMTTETQMGIKNVSANQKSHAVKLTSNTICQDS